jgi:hypothetical protein
MGEGMPGLSQDGVVTRPSRRARPGTRAGRPLQSAPPASGDAVPAVTETPFRRRRQGPAAAPAPSLPQDLR